MKNHLRLISMLILLFSAVGAFADDLPKTSLKVMGSYSYLNATQQVEKPFWTKTLPADSNGAITVSYATLDQLGLNGTEVLRLLRSGAVSIASADLSYMGTDNAAFNALGLPGLLKDIKTARAAVEAYKPVLDKLMRSMANAHLLAVWPAPPQAFYCKKKFDGVTSLSGRRIRVFNKPLSELVASLDAIPVTMPATEVVASLQRGAVDCGITGTLSGNTGKWPSVTDYFMPINLGYTMWFQAVSLKEWDSLDPSVKAFLKREIAKLEDNFWKNAALEQQDGINCNIGQGKCIFGTKESMQLVNVTPEDVSKINDILKEKIIPSWASRCGGDCVEKFNATVGPIVGITVNK